MATVDASAARRLLAARDVPARVLAHLAESLCGPEWLKWEEPETAWRTLARACHVLPGDISIESKEKLSALKVAVVTDALWFDQDVFENVVIAFSDGVPTWGLLEGFDVEHAAWAIEELEALG